MTKKITIIGGAGHIGLPLSVLFANSNIKVNCYDKNQALIKQCKKGIFPFKEKNGKSQLQKAIKSKKINFISSPDNTIKNSDIIITIGTPVDEFMNPITDLIYKCLDEIIPFVSNNSLIILRSTVYPGTTEMVQKYLKKTFMMFIVLKEWYNVLLSKKLINYHKLLQLLRMKVKKEQLNFLIR